MASSERGVHVVETRGRGMGETEQRRDEGKRDDACVIYG